MNRLTLVTFNIQQAMQFSPKRLHLRSVCSALRSLKVDIVLLQEVWIRDGSTFKEMLGGEFQQWKCAEYAEHAQLFGGHQGNAILSTFPLLFKEAIPFSTFHRQPRAMLHVDLALNDTSCSVYNVHLGLGAQERQAQADQLIDVLKRHPLTSPLLLGGDFNDWRRKLSPQFKEGLGLTEAFLKKMGRHARSFPARLPILPLDRMYTRNIQVLESQILKGHPWRHLSDHRPYLIHITHPG